jgi:membrane-bound lytic murein transglycosylase D
MKYFKFLVLSLLAVVFITASDPFFGIELRLKPVPKEQPGDVRERLWMSTEAFRPYLIDHDDRVSDIFKVDSYYYPNVHFWFLIYTQFESTSVVIHDKSNLSLIYKVLDFSSLKKKQLPKNTLYVLQQKLSEEKLQEMKKDLETLSQDPYSISPWAGRIYRLLKQAGVTVPSRKEERSKFFLKLRDNLRTQTGQKDFIRDGIIRSLPYQKFLTGYFEDRKLPRELLAIPFLESSFNPKAQSKVDALGIWQFMPLISSYYVPKRTKSFDYRFNVGVASVAAANLLYENHKIMKSWDLAVTAYNSGTKHLLKTKREIGRNVNLREVIEHSDSQHFGFASKNFYSEFLALAHTLAYREELFNDLHESDRPDVNDNFRFYLSKCSMKLDKVLSDKELDDVYFHNHHTDNANSNIPKGFILISKTPLPKNRFLEIPYKEVLKNKPKDWDRLGKRYSCSIR